MLHLLLSCMVAVSHHLAYQKVKAGSGNDIVVDWAPHSQALLPYLTRCCRALRCTASSFSTSLGMYRIQWSCKFTLA